MKLNLRNRILLPTLTLTFAITALLSLVSFSMSRKALNDSFNSQLRQICESSLQQVESWVEGQRLNVTHWASQPHIVEALDNSAEGSAAAKVADEQFADAYKAYGFFDSILLIDPQGNTVSASDMSSVGTLNVVDRAYFKEAMSGKVVISEVLKNKATGHPIVVVASPVKNGEKIRGLLVATLNLEWFSANIVDKIQVLQTGNAFMYDEKGVFISHRDKSLIMTTKITDYPWGASFLKTTEGENHYSFMGVDKVAYFKNSEKLHWGLAASVPIAEIQAPTYRMGAIDLILGTGSILAGAFAMFLTARSLSKPIDNATRELNQCSAESTSAASQVSDSSMKLAEGSTEQAASLEETSASLEEMSSMTKRNADSATKANELAKAARIAAEAGAEDMRTMGAAMGEIKSSSDDIAKIIKTIDEIAFQTNILALNAAVEAARAGEAGAGFAVVADEVRSLAQRAAGASKETAAKIESAIVKTSQGVQISDKVATRLIEIVEKIRQVDGLISEVATASREQNEGVTQINASIHQMDKVVQTNAAGAEESAAAAEELNAQAIALNSIVSTLRQLVAGGGRTEPAPLAQDAPAITRTSVSERVSSSQNRSRNSAPRTEKNHAFRD